MIERRLASCFLVPRCDKTSGSSQFSRLEFTVKTLIIAAILALFGFTGRAYGQLTMTDLKTTALDANGKPELHLLLTGIRGPTTNLRIKTDTATYDFPWSSKTSTADVWIAVGQWNSLTLQLTYAAGGRDTVTMAKVETKKQ
jgi:hypothetical protein